jgi:hypothetical protein
VGASLGELAKSMKATVKMVEDTAKKVKESASAIAGVGGLFAAGIAAAVDAASQQNKRLAADVERLKRLLYTLAADIGDLFAPYVRQLADAVSRFVAFVQQLDPEVKAGAARFAVFAAASSVVAAKVSVASALVEGLAKASGAILVPALNSASVAAKSLGAAGGAMTRGLTAFAWLANAPLGAVFSKGAAGADDLKKGLEGAGKVVPPLSASLSVLVGNVAALSVPILAAMAAVAGLALLAGSLYR